MGYPLWAQHTRRVTVLRTRPVGAHIVRPYTDPPSAPQCRIPPLRPHFPLAHGGKL